jgi:hypothetical protein
MPVDGITLSDGKGHERARRLAAMLACLCLARMLSRRAER